MAQYFKIFDIDGNFKEEVTYDADCGNHGLPDSYFLSRNIAIYVDDDKDLVEWVPEMGPAPIWKDKLSNFEDNAALFSALLAWAERNR